MDPTPPTRLERRRHSECRQPAEFRPRPDRRLLSRASRGRTVNARHDRTAGRAQRFSFRPISGGCHRRRASMTGVMWSRIVRGCGRNDHYQYRRHRQCPQRWPRPELARSSSGHQPRVYRCWPIAGLEYRRAALIGRNVDNWRSGFHLPVLARRGARRRAPPPDDASAQLLARALPDW